MSTYKLTNNKLNPNRVFILQKSEIDKRFDPNSYRVEIRNVIQGLKKSGNKLENLKFVSNFNKNLVKEIPLDLPYVGLENIESNTGTYISTTEKESISSAIIFKKGQVLFPKLRPYLNKVYYTEFDGVCSTEFHVLDSKIVSNEYLANFLRTNIVVNQTKFLMSGNTLPRLQTEDIERLLIPILKPEEENKINFIMQKVYEQKKQNEAEAEKLLASIDTYLLNELGVILPIQEKNTLQSRMFTTSLKELSSSRFDPNFHRIYFKDVFNSFENGKYEYSVIKNHTSFQPGYAFKSTDYVDDSNCILITIKNIRQNQIDIKNTTYLPDEFYEIYEDFQIKKDDLLIAMTGATIGKVGIYDLDEKSLLNQRNGIIKTTNINSIYLMNLLNLKVFQSIILRNSNGGAQPNISETDIMKIKIPVPPLEKQIEIANHISAIRQQAQALKDKSKLALQQANIEIENLLLN
jgi:restriction endonuclease S subunit